MYILETDPIKHGVPISVKEHIGLKGRICHTGYVAWYFHPRIPMAIEHTDLLTHILRIKNIAPEDALLVQLLKKAGAIFHVRTNQPQSLMVRLP